jgi:hypothetical protein
VKGLAESLASRSKDVILVGALSLIGLPLVGEFCRGFGSSSNIPPVVEGAVPNTGRDAGLKLSRLKAGTGAANGFEAGSNVCCEGDVEITVPRDDPELSIGLVSMAIARCSRTSWSTHISPAYYW